MPEDTNREDRASRIAIALILAGIGATAWGVTRLPSTPEGVDVFTNDYACLVAHAKVLGYLQEPEAAVAFMTGLNPGDTSDIAKKAQALRRNPVGNPLTKKELKEVVTVEVQPPDGATPPLDEYALVGVVDTSNGDPSLGYSVLYDQITQAIQPVPGAEKVELAKPCALPNGQTELVRAGFLYQHDNIVVQPEKLP